MIRLEKVNANARNVKATQVQYAKAAHEKAEAQKVACDFLSFSFKNHGLHGNACVPCNPWFNMHAYAFAMKY